MVKAFDPAPLVSSDQFVEVKESVSMLSMHPCFPSPGRQSLNFDLTGQINIVSRQPQTKEPGPLQRLFARKDSSHCPFHVKLAANVGVMNQGHNIVLEPVLVGAMPMVTTSLLCKRTSSCVVHEPQAWTDAPPVEISYRGNCMRPCDQNSKFKPCSISCLSSSSSGGKAFCVSGHNQMRCTAVASWWQCGH